ncbi:MAG: FkbM family methyltransferase [Proteobacteria bacterium]|nr:FkbM family methyltransferase [Pseudomonadota bacterium]MBU1711635.1 FkbM family methyltransferase [Pseudomonadota bacterium]
MVKLFDTLLRNTIFAKKNNLLSIDDPYSILERLLKSHKITGIIDAGASNGRISKKLLKIFPEASVYAFEPNPLYEKTLNQFAWEDKRFFPYYFALSDHKGFEDFCITVSPGNTSLFKPGKRLKEIDPDGASLKSTKKVEVMPVDEWLKENGNHSIQLIKLDIQGAELLALRGAENVLKNSVLAVYTEILFNPLYEGGALYSDIDLCLRNYGFVLYDIFKPKYNSNGLLMWGNAIFLNSNKFGF